MQYDYDLVIAVIIFMLHSVLISTPSFRCVYTAVYYCFTYHNTYMCISRIIILLYTVE